MFNIEFKLYFNTLTTCFKNSLLVAKQHYVKHKKSPKQFQSIIIAFNVKCQRTIKPRNHIKSVMK